VRAGVAHLGHLTEAKMCAVDPDPFTQHQLPHHHKTEHHQCHQQLRVEQQAPGARKSATGRTAATSLQIWYILHVILVLIGEL